MRDLLSPQVQKNCERNGLKNKIRTEYILSKPHKDSRDYLNFKTHLGFCDSDLVVC